MLNLHSIGIYFRVNINRIDDNSQKIIIEHFKELDSASIIV